MSLYLLQYCWTYRSGSPYIVLSIEGQGFFKTRNPPAFGGTSIPFSSRTAASIPGNGIVAEPGFVATTPGMGVIIIIPVSVCHHVSTIGHFSFPMFFRYHIH